MHVDFKLLLTLGVGCVAAAPLPAQTNAVPPPTPATALERAWDAAGGMEMFKAIGVMEVRIKREEVTQDGQRTSAEKTLVFLAPGPTPGRMENPALGLVAGDDGSGGWAMIGTKVDARPSTPHMVKRLLTGDLFPLLLPFSLSWDGVTVTDVVPAEVAGRAVWRLKVGLSRTFFHTPQISTSWTVDLDRRTFGLVRADSPSTDLGKGLVADGMRISWAEPVRLKGIVLHGYQRTVGLDDIGREKSHSRVDHITYRASPREGTEKLFANPVPPAQRPRVPMMQPPGEPATKPGG